MLPWGGWRAELGPAEGDEEAPSGDLQKEHTATAAPGLLHTVAPQFPSLPANVRAAGGASPAASGVSVDGTCALGRRAKGILHSSVQIVTTLLSPHLWSHSAADPRVFAHVSEAPSELGS